MGRSGINSPIGFAQLIPPVAHHALMYVDIGSVLDSQPGLSRAALERLDERVAAIHEHIEQEITTEGFGYRSLALGSETDPDRIANAVEPLADCETVLTVGIGGSALGSATVTSALGVGENNPVCDNVDPQQLSSQLSSLTWDQTAVHVVSQSGTTAETLSNFLIVREAMADAGVDWTEQTIVTTGADGPLRELVDRHDLPSLSVPAGVPGRFSVLSTTSLVAPTILGCDVEQLLAGGRAARNSLSASLFETPAYAYAAVAYALEQRGANINAFVPYAERLEPFAEWFAQLWAESLGKDGLGQTPVRALGATDQHSQLQLYRAGRHDKLVTLVRPRERPELTIPSTEIDALSYLGDTGLGALLDAEFEATEASLAAANQPTVRLEIDALDAYSLGELLVSMEAATIMTGELLEVETFTQPAVEWGKRAARGLLGGDDTPEANAVGDTRSLTIEGP